MRAGVQRAQQDVVLSHPVPPEVFVLGLRSVQEGNEVSRLCQLVHMCPTACVELKVHTGTAKRSVQGTTGRACCLGLPQAHDMRQAQHGIACGTCRQLAPPTSAPTCQAGSIYAGESTARLTTEFTASCGAEQVKKYSVTSGHT